MANFQHTLHFSKFRCINLAEQSYKENIDRSNLFINMSLLICIAADLGVPFLFTHKYEKRKLIWLYIINKKKHFGSIQ